MEYDRLLPIVVGAEFVDEDPVTFDVTIATTFPFPVERVVVVAGKEFLLPNEHAHDNVELFDIATACS